MRRVVVVLSAVLLAVAFSSAVASAAPDEAKWVRGKVTAMGGDSISVTVKGKEWKFAVDGSTKVVARGAGTKAAAAAEAGKAGPKLADVVKVGDNVQVTYMAMGSTMHASEIRGGVGGDMTSDEAAKTVSGTVTAVAADSLTVKGGSQEWKFSIDSSTKVIGRGAGTASREKGGKIGITDLVGANDKVTVAYHDMGGTLHADEVRVTAKAAKTSM